MRKKEEFYLKKIAITDYQHFRANVSCGTIMVLEEKYDLIVVGGAHVGCETFYVPSDQRY